MSALVRQAIAAPAPEDESEKEAWNNRIIYVKQIEEHSEYALYSTAIQSPPAAMLDLLSALEQQNPKSKYLDEAYGPYCAAMSKTGASSWIPAIAEKALANFPENEDLLYILANDAAGRQQSDRALNFSTRLIGVLNRHSKPEGLPAAEWERKLIRRPRTRLLPGRGDPCREGRLRHSRQGASRGAPLDQRQ